MFAVHFTSRVPVPEILKPIVTPSETGFSVDDVVQFTILPKSLSLGLKTKDAVVFELFAKINGENKPVYIIAPSVDELASITAY